SSGTTVSPRRQRMPRKAKAATQAVADSNEQQTPPQATAKSESIAGYFRRIFRENPKLLGLKSNETLLQQWLADHPGHSEAPDSVKQGLANIKSVLRKKRKRKGRKAAAQSGQPAREKAPPATAAEERPLERLEYLIDQCLTIARDQQSAKLQGVIGH